MGQTNNYDKWFNLKIWTLRRQHAKPI